MSTHLSPSQKIKLLILITAATWNEQAFDPAIDGDQVEELYDELVGEGEHWDAGNDVRGSGIETSIHPPTSRHYESKSLARQLPDGSWVGWTYWYGGGKHADPGSVEWISKAYDLECKEEQQTVTVRTFTVPEVTAEHV